MKTLLLLPLLCLSAMGQPKPRPAFNLGPPMPPTMMRSVIHGNLLTDTNQPGVTGHIVTPGYAAVVFAWEPLTNDWIAGYRIYYSTKSGSYDTDHRCAVDGYTSSNMVVSPLQYGTHYWFVLVSVASQDSESLYSQEVDWITEGPPLTNWAYTVTLQAGPTTNGPWTNTSASLSWTGLSTAPMIFFQPYVTRTNVP